MTERPPTPALTVDAVVPYPGGRLVLVRRNHPPCAGAWALPGGHVLVGETVEQACLRELQEETGLSGQLGPLLGVFSDPRRNPVKHTVTVAFVVYPGREQLRPGPDEQEVEVITYRHDLELAFDHHEIIRTAIDKGLLLP